MGFEQARRVADAVLLEGYVLYPYRASAVKNRMRWQFGVLAPEGATTGEPAFCQTECLIEAGERARLDLRLRFLHVRAGVAAGVDTGAWHSPDWDEGTLREVTAGVALDGTVSRHEVPFTVPGGRESVDGTDYDGRRLDGTITVGVERLDGPYGLVRARVRIDNRTLWRGADASRADMLRSAMVSAHTLLRVTGGSFVSLLDPPEWAATAAAGCENLHTWPVLTGEDDRRDTMLSSPIILYDHPRVAPESPVDLCDATEIDEILTLRTMALTEDEKHQARATDARSARIIEHVDSMPSELLERLHGALRSLDAVTGRPDRSGTADAAATPCWDPGSDTAAAPDTGVVAVSGGSAGKGSSVVLRPGQRRADAQDMFLHGKRATVSGVFYDVDGHVYLAVTVDEDLASDLHRWHGRYLYFTPDEVELGGEA